MSIGETIKKLREERGWTQEQLAKKMGYAHKSSITKIEMGKNDLPQSKLTEFAKIFNIPPAAFFSGDGEALKNYGDLILPIRKNTFPLLGTIAAGQPILAEENVECYVETLDNIQADFALRVKGDSMINARIYDGDIVFIRQQPTVDNGQIAAVLIDDEATLKRVYFREDGIMLVPENNKYAPFYFRESDAKDIRIIGRAVAFQSYVH